ncbi:MAG: ferritin family protein [Bacilli bacterium]|nr:ferritin family protein [Bacilli bacterium]
MNFQAPGPYPDPRVEAPNKEYAYMLLQSYTGENSENTASNLYLYQYFIQNEKYQDVANALQRISYVERLHLQLLGETIELLGVHPVYKTKSAATETMIPWTADFVNYETEILKQLEIDIVEETAAIRTYEMQREVIQDKYIQELITRIIADEEVHLQIFRMYYNEFSQKDKSELQ